LGSRRKHREMKEETEVGYEEAVERGAAEAEPGKGEEPEEGAGVHLLPPFPALHGFLVSDLRSLLHLPVFFSLPVSRTFAELFADATNSTGVRKSA
jgi:hypothetical protein